ncbi:hypothetical protein P692DRAFT_20214470 [Suillus brevipes Sb2]|nr:hypothetical protein P692DRAFT_20214470 [Suillus brevipes Sb2]
MLREPRAQVIKQFVVTCITNTMIYMDPIIGPPGIKAGFTTFNRSLGVQQATKLPTARTYVHDIRHYRIWRGSSIVFEYQAGTEQIICYSSRRVIAYIKT